MENPTHKDLVDVNNLPWPAVLFRWKNNDFFIMDFNEAAAKIEGLVSGEVINRPLKPTFPGVEKLGLYDKLLKVKNEGRGEFLETSFYQDHRSQGWRENYIIPLANDDLLVIYYDTNEKVKREEEHSVLGQIIDATFNEVFLFSIEDYRFVFANQAAMNNLGYSLAELKRMAPYDIKPLFNREQFIEYLMPIRTRRKKHVTFETQHERKDGSLYDVEIRMQLMNLNGQQLVVVIANDITERKQQEQKKELLSQAVMQTDDMISITDSNGVIIYVNDAFCKHTGYSRQELIGQTNSQLKSGEHDVEFYQALWQTLISGETFKSTFVNRKKDGSLFFVDQVITPIFSEQNQLTHFVSTGNDSTEQVHLNNRLTEMATMDSLTGVFNRHKITELLENEINRFQHNPLTPFGLLMFDIDHFKKINDTYGHTVGDTVLKELCQAVRSGLRKSDSFGRMGGEEFLILAPNIMSESSLYALTEKLLQVVADKVFTETSKVTVSIGVTLVQPKDSSKTLLKRVDDALYIAKNSGRNQGVYLLDNHADHIQACQGVNI